MLLCELSATGQGLPGYSSGNYTGVNGVFTNPANIADSRYRWDLNLLGIGMMLGNNTASFRRKDFYHFDGDTLEDRFFSGGKGQVSGAAALSLTGPSVFFNLGKKSAIALTSQSRLLVNISDMDAQLGRQLIDNETVATYPYDIASNHDMVMSANWYTSFGLTYSRVIYSEGKHFLKAGVTLKYLIGSVNGFAEINGLHTTVGRDDEKQKAYLTGTSGSFAMGFGGANLFNATASDLLDYQGTGFGGDIGFVYEYRPDTTRIYGGQNKYKFKIGLSLMDVGSIRYKRDQNRSGNYQIHIPDGQRFYLNTIMDTPLDHITDSLDSYPQYFTPKDGQQASTYKMSLPTTLRLAIDYHLHRSFYVSLAAQAALTSSGNPANSWEYSAATLTPRYEGRGLGLYVPLTYSSLSGGSAGLALRLGPLFFGSGSILSAAFGSSRRADVFFGMHFGGLKSKHRVKRVKIPKVKKDSSPNVMQ